MSGAWGSGGWGSGAWGGAVGGDIELVAAVAYRENVIRLEFTKPVNLTGLLEDTDASRLDKWLVTPDTTTTGMNDEAARAVAVALVTLAADVADEDEGRFVDLTLDRPMTPYPAVYVVEFVQIFARDLGSTIAGDVRVTATFKALAPPRIDQARPVRDFALPTTISDARASGPDPETALTLGTYQVDDSGDYAFDEGMASLRKRVVRRLITRKGAFAHLPNYGVGIPDYAKRLAIASVLSGLAADAEVQISQEPDVQKVKVSATVDPNIPNLVRFRVVIRPTVGSPVQFDVPFLQAA